MRLNNAVYALVVGVVVLALSACSGQGLAGSSEIKTEKTAVNLAREAERGGYRLVTTDELKVWKDQKKDMMLIDTMPFEASYKKNHIPGAVQFEFPIPEVTSMDAKMKASFTKLLGANKDRQLVFYCGFTTCTRSHNGALWAKKLGYKNVYRHPGGIKAWIEAKYPVDTVK